MNVYAIGGAPPEVLAYGMAKYSRSSQTLKESLREITSERAATFLETFYFQYGHASIADMAPIPLAIEDISLLAAYALEDDPLWNGQERSTRYQDFSGAPMYVPPAVGDDKEHYMEVLGNRLNAYDFWSQALVEILQGLHERPESMPLATYRRTIRARACDVARYFLPLATLTSVGQVTTARVLQRQVCRLRASPYEEVQRMARNMIAACHSPSFDMWHSAEEGNSIAPTLLRHVEQDQYEWRVLRRVEEELGAALSAWQAPAMSEPLSILPRLLETTGIEKSTLATLTYLVDPGHRSYQQHLYYVHQMPSEQRNQLFLDTLAARGEHDELLRAHQVGGSVVVDLCVDLGALRDLHRHRRLTQFTPPFTADLGHDGALPILLGGTGEEGLAQMQKGGLVDQFAFDLDQALREAREFPTEWLRPYLLPLAARQRALLKMDLSEAAYIAELRSGPAGHFSYRFVAQELYKQLSERISPLLAGALRVTPTAEVDFLKR